MKKFLLFLMFALFCIPWAANAQTLTVHDGTGTNAYVPFYGYYADEDQQNQMIYPATELSDMIGMEITQMVFYYASQGSYGSGVGTWTIKLGETDQTTLDDLDNTTPLIEVFTGDLDALFNTTDQTLLITFNNSYTYNGGNLLVEFSHSASGYLSYSFYGETVTGASYCYDSQQNFLPKTTFSYEVPSSCSKPTDFTVSNVTANSATLSWEGETDYPFYLQYGIDNTFAQGTYDDAQVEELLSYTLTDLTPNTTYYVRVQKDCDMEVSGWVNTSFTTANPCTAPTGFTASNITGSSATISWTAGYQETEWTVKYKKSSESSWDNATTVSVSGTPTTNLTGLDGLTVYNVRVYNCTGESDPYLSGNFTTAASFPYSQDFSGSTSIPTGWTNYTGLLSAVMNGTALTNGGNWYFGNFNGVFDSHARLNIYGLSCKYWLVTPVIPVASGARLTFDVAYTAYDGTAANPATTGTDDKFVVLASTDNMATWTILRQWDNAGSEYVLNELTPTALYQIFDLADYAGQNVIVAFYGESTESNADNNIHVDNVVFELTPSCEKPTGLAVTANSVTAHGATITWTSDASAWQIQLGDADPIDVTAATYTFTDLAPETAYSVKVRANCDGTFSEWTTPVSFTTAIACPAPTGLFATLTPGNGTVVDLDWTETGTASQWELQYDTEADFSNPTIFTLNYIPRINITGFTPETTYYARIKAVCGGEDGESAWSNTITFTPTNAYSLTVDRGTLADINNYVPVYGLYVDDYSYSQFIIPADSLETMKWGNVTKMTFYSNTTSAPWTSAKFEVYMTETEETTLSALTDWTTMDKVMNEAHLEISGNQMVVTLDVPYQYMGGNLMVGVKQTVSGTYKSTSFYGVSATGASMGGYGTSVSQRNFLPMTTFAYTPGEEPACPKPTGLAVTTNSVTAHGATITWTSDASAWQIQLGENAPIDVTEATYTFTGLAPETAYSVKVRANCNGTFSEWTTPVSFTTAIACPAPTGLAASDITGHTATLNWNGTSASYVVMLGETVISLGTADFEDQTIPSDWTNDATYPWVITNAAAAGGTYSMKSGNTGVNSSTSSIQITVSYAETTTLEFDARCSSEQTSLSNDWDYGTFYIDGVQKGDKIINSTTFTHYSYEVEAGTHTFMWKYKKDGSVGSNDDCLYVDNIVNVPSATVNSWIEYTSDSPTYTLEDLTPETSYQVKVKGNCGDDGMSLETAPISFTTLSDCPVPQNLAVTTNGATATATWAGTEATCNISINGTVYNNVTSPYEFEVELSTSYEVMVQANCAGDETSEWTAPVSITTPPCVGGHTIEYTLNDSYGDGWNGASITFVEGCDQTNLTLSSGASSSGTLTICNDYFAFIWNSGSYDSECSFTFTENGTTLFTKPSSISDGMVLYTIGTQACAIPTGLDTSSLGTHSVELSWTSEATAWQICVNGDEDNLIDVDENPYVLSNLDADADYTVKVRANCSETEQSCWSDEVSFHTLVACPKPTDLTYSINADGVTVGWEGSADGYEMEYAVNNNIFDFDDGTLQGWTNLIVNEDGGQWLHSNGNLGAYDYTGYAHGGTGFAMCYSYVDYVGSYNTDAYLVSPQMYQINEGTSLNFWYDMANDLYPEDFAVCVATAANPTASDFTSIWSLNASKGNSPKSDLRRRNIRSDNWREVTIDLSSYAGQSIWIAFRDVNEDMYEVWIDDITIDNGDITWIPVEGTVTSPYTLNSLESSTRYIVRVHSICNEEASAWSTLSFTTPASCGTGIVLNEANPTWTANFDNMTNVTEPKTGVSPRCWSWINLVTVDVPDTVVPIDTVPFLYYGADRAHSGSYSLRSHFRGINVMPVLDEESVDIQQVKLSFWVKQPHWFYPMQVGVMTDPTDYTTFEPVAYVDNGHSTDYRYYEINFTGYTGEGRYIAFKHIVPDATSRDIHSVNFIDDITLSLIQEGECTMEWPYAENFDDLETAPLSCWELVNAEVTMRDDKLPMVYNEGTNYSLQMADRCVYALPLLPEDVEVTSLQLSMDVRQPNVTYQLEVGVWDGTTFEPVALVNNSGTGYTPFSCDFTHYKGEGRRIAFRNTLNNGVSYKYSYNYIDNIELTVGGAVCAGPVSLPYEQDFEGFELSTEPTCWELVQVQEGVTMRYDKYPQVYTDGGDKCLRLADRCVYALPEIPTTSTVSDLTLSLKVRQPNVTYQLEVGVWDGTTFESVALVNNSDLSEAEASVDFSGYDGEGRRIALRNTLNNGVTYSYSYNYIDEINLHVTGTKSMASGSDEMDAAAMDSYLNNIAVYPNPTTGVLHIDAVDVQKVECYSQMGQLVGVYDNVNELNISELADGVYMLRITVPQGVTMRKVVKR